MQSLLNHFFILLIQSTVGCIDHHIKKHLLKRTKNYKRKKNTPPTADLNYAFQHLFFFKVGQGIYCVQPIYAGHNIFKFLGNTTSWGSPSRYFIGEKINRAINQGSRLLPLFGFDRQTQCALFRITTRVIIQGRGILSSVQ